MHVIARPTRGRVRKFKSSSPTPGWRSCQSRSCAATRALWSRRRSLPRGARGNRVAAVVERSDHDFNDDFEQVEHARSAGGAKTAPLEHSDLTGRSKGSAANPRRRQRRRRSPCGNRHNGMCLPPAVRRARRSSPHHRGSRRRARGRPVGRSQHDWVGPPYGIASPSAHGRRSCSRSESGERKNSRAVAMSPRLSGWSTFDADSIASQPFQSGAAST
jgi:hypothetical protein